MNDTSGISGVFKDASKTNMNNDLADLFWDERYKKYASSKTNNKY
jgi:hypothetical protein